MEHLLKVLQFTLSSDQTARISAELELISLSSQNNTGSNLARIATEGSLDVHIRQITSFVLKRCVKERWSPFFPTFKGGPATTFEEKATIRQLIFSALADPERKIRLACASIISDIAHPDWPDDWPTLTTELLALIDRGRTQEEVEGGMRVLNEFVGIDLTEDQFLPLAREMLPRLLEILMDREVHSPSTRARSILIFKQCVMTLFTVKDEHPAAVKSAISEILPQWLQAFVQLLQVEVAPEVSGDNWDGLSIRIAIFNTLEIILNSFPTLLTPHIPIFLQSSLSHLSHLYPIFSNYYLSNSTDSLPPTSTEEDSDISSDLPGLVAIILDFLSQLSRRKNVKQLFLSVLDQSLEMGIRFASMTTDDEETWASDPNAFVADEDDEMVSFNVRLASIDFVIALVDTFEKQALGSLWSAFQSQAANAENAKISQDEDWWKIYESGLAIVGAVSTELLIHVQESSASGIATVFDLSQLFTSIVPAYLSSSDLPFLQGRSFVFASQFAQALPAGLANSYIDAAIQVLELSSAGVPVKVSAVRALNNFFRHLKEGIDIERATRTLGQLLPLLPQTTENTLVLIIDTLEATLKVGGNALDKSLCTLLVNTVLSTWFEKPQDPVLGASICELFEAFSAISTPVIEQNLLLEALPSLATVMSEIAHDPFSPRAAAAIEIVDGIFMGRPTPIGEGMFNTVAEVLFQVLATTDDREIQQTGLHVITTIVRKDIDQLLNWRSSAGQSGLELVLAQVARLLDPNGSESGGLFVGDLVIHLIRKAGSALGPVLPELLRAFVNRLATAETASFSQSLILPFAYLLHDQCDTVLALLDTIQVPATSVLPARSALEVLLSTWCDNVEVFQGYWNIKVSTVALCQLFVSSNSSVSQINVKGDLLLTAANSNAIMTRARAKNNPDQFPPIPFFAKALKILLHDVQSLGDDGAMGKIGLDDAESDDGDEEWADDGAEFRTGDEDLDLLSDMLNGGGSLAKYLNEDDSDDDGQDQEGEEDLKDDPIYILDIRSHLVAFFQQVYKADTNSFRQLVETYLTNSEREILAQVLQA